MAHPPEMEFRPFNRWAPWVVPSFVVVNVLLFLITMYVNDCPKYSFSCFARFLGRFSFQPLKENPLLGPSSAALEKMGALEVYKVVIQHQAWRLITSIWLHAGVVHILANMLSLVFIGIRLEQEFGFVKIGLLYVISGFGANILSSLFLQSAISVGASGALFGLLGAMLSELLTNWTIYANKLAALLTLILIIILNLAVGVLPHVDNFAHIGGFITGFFLGFMLLIRPQYGWVSQKHTYIGSSAGPRKSKHKPYQYVLWIVAAVVLIGGMASYKGTTDASKETHNDVFIRNEMVHEENVHEENNKEQPLEEYEERMGRLENVSTLLAELVQDSRKKKNTNEEDSASMFKKFSSLNPPSYDVKQVYGGRSTRKGRIESGFSWTKLQELMRDRFYPLSLRRQKEDEFLHLQQGTMSVLDYANKFMELSRFAPELVSTEQSRMNRFERGLHLKYQDRLSSQRFTTYQDMVDVAVNVERVVLLREAQNVGYKRRNDNQNQGGTKRKNQSQQGGYSGNRGQGQQGGNKNQNNRSQVVCAKCGRRSHTENECRVGTAGDDGDE
uniref:RHOMBOID-like protein n=1 Tax=Chenopodium quinoa TaxID=63459 RepID=A0A803KRW7_CHEQI